MLIVICVGLFLSSLIRVLTSYCAYMVMHLFAAEPLPDSALLGSVEHCYLFYLRSTFMTHSIK
jgi:hypothetical protein